MTAESRFEQIQSGTPGGTSSEGTSTYRWLEVSNKIGMDTTLEALKLYRHRKKVKVEDLLKYARISSFEKVICPFLVAVL